MQRKCAWFLALLLLPVLAGAAQDTVWVTDNSILPGQQVTWTPGKLYVLKGFVFVDEGAVLNIDAGTVIRAMPGQGANASALLVARGGKIYARGTATKPIIFTGVNDDVNNPNDIPQDTRGLWGGVIILGRARLNSAPGQTIIEGIPTTETRGMYGGTDDNDNSGVFRYVSIRYGGSIIGANNEINGLTMGGVGAGTTIEYVEVLNNADDGFEWFGGTVNCKYLVSAFNDDDCFDYDEGWRGKGQFWVALQDPKIGNRMGEHDGGTTPEDGRPYAIPTLYNATYIGSGVNSSNAANDYGIIMRDNAGGKYLNSVFTDFLGKGLKVEDKANVTIDSRQRLEAGDILYSNNIWWLFGPGATGASIDVVSNGDAWTRDHLLANDNRLADPLLTNVIRAAYTDQLDLRPKAGSPALTNPAALPTGDRWFSPTPYLGAFGPTNWMAGWTALCPINHAPVVVGSIGAQSLTVSGGPRSIDLSGLVTDADGDPLSYMFSTSNSRVVRVALSGSNTLVVTPRAAGSATVRVSISDGRGNPTVTVIFPVTVRAGKESAEQALPTSLSLAQNYPNPFNPSTTIYFEVPVAGGVRLTVYDMLGQQVATLVDETRSPGSYAVEFDAAGLSSGTYVYRLETGAGVLARTMSLVR